MSDHEIEQEQRRYDEAQDANDRAYAEGFAAGVAAAREKITSEAVRTGQLRFVEVTDLCKWLDSLSSLDKEENHAV